MDTIESLRPVSDEVRKAIAESELSRYEIARRSGIQQSALARFLAGERGLWTVTLDRLFPVLGLKIVSTAPDGAEPDGSDIDKAGSRKKGRRRKSDFNAQTQPT